jgi:hypothetical protein
MTRKLGIADAKLFWNLSRSFLFPAVRRAFGCVTPETIISAVARVYTQPQNPDRRFAQAFLLR